MDWRVFWTLFIITVIAGTAVQRRYGCDDRLDRLLFGPEAPVVKPQAAPSPSGQQTVQRQIVQEQIVEKQTLPRDPVQPPPATDTTTGPVLLTILVALIMIIGAFVAGWVCRSHCRRCGHHSHVCPSCGASADFHCPRCGKAIRRGCP